MEITGCYLNKRFPYSQQKHLSLKTKNQKIKRNKFILKDTHTTTPKIYLKHPVQMV